MNLQFSYHTLKLKSHFTISRSTRIDQKTTIVELSDGEGTTGYGEVSDNEYYTQAHPDEVTRTLSYVMQKLSGNLVDDPTTLYDNAHKALQLLNEPVNYFALSALDMAANDLAAKRQGKSLYTYWGYKWDDKSIPVSNYTLSIDTPEQVLAQAQKNPWPSYKVKLGGKHDLQTMALLRENLPKSTVLCVDANTGWTIREGIPKIEALSKLGVAFVEQPMQRGAYTQTAELQKAKKAAGISVPVVADEDCQTEEDISRCAAAGYDVVNIKLCKCGGPSPARRMVEEAKSLGLKVMFGCMIESSFAIGALRHFAPVADFIDLDGALLVSEDLAAGVEFHADGTPKHPFGLGSGVAWQ